MRDDVSTLPATTAAGGRALTRHPSVARTRTGANAPPDASALPRFFREGEAEEREPRLSESALARWKDESRRTLLCPRCGVEEVINE